MSERVFDPITMSHGRRQRLNQFRRGARPHGLPSLKSAPRLPCARGGLVELGAKASSPRVSPDGVLGGLNGSDDGLLAEPAGGFGRLGKQTAANRRSAAVRCEAGAQQVPAETWLLIDPQVSWNSRFSTPPKAKITTMISAAMPA